MSIKDLWLKEYTSKDDQGIDHCGLCGNYGFVDTTRLDVRTPAGVKVKPIKVFCICPNGRVMKRKKCLVEGITNEG